ncbi:tetratricopeptide repeat-containing protein [Solibacillus sp. FSL H8-0538]|uniref:tetratricopeptide repeat-containing protein n=1 Tax=Solibacillus sp. FSL H8-0538 TaxID=2921400 RepID=UPI0030FCAE9F
MEVNHEFTGFVIFADLKGFSSLEESMYEDYAYTLRTLDKAIAQYKKGPSLQNDEKIDRRAIMLNTWGDAVVAVFRYGVDAANFILTYREFYQKNKALNLEPRIAAHYGKMRLFDDPILNGAKNAFGENVNIAARIEPITFPGEIYVTAQFKEQFEREYKDKEHRHPYYEELLPEYEQVAFQDLKDWKLAKDYGEAHLYRLYHIKEEAWNINGLFVEKQNTTLDTLHGIIDVDIELEKASKEVRRKVEDATSKEESLQALESYELQSQQHNGPLLYAVSKIYQDIGEYEIAIQYIQQARKWKREVGLSDTEVKVGQKKGIVTQPLLHNIKLLKLEADCLSKSNQPDKYKQAKQLLYEVLQMNPDDNDTLCKLAAQMKREAFSIAEKDRDIEHARDMLKQSLRLYLEAFRRTGDYYPAINATYIKRLLNEGDSWQLADYIFDTWKERTGENWWIDSTLAESQMLMNDYESAINRMRRAIVKHKPKFFEKEAAYIQIETYERMLDKIAGKPQTESDQQYMVELLALFGVRKKVEL